MTPQDPYDDYLYEHGLSDLSDYLGYSPPRDITRHQEDVEDYEMY
jgi:hypothetical protein